MLSGVRLSGPEVRPRSRMRGPVALLISIRRLRARADKAAVYRAATAEEKRWCHKVADACDGLLEHWQRSNAEPTTEPD